MNLYNDASLIISPNGVKAGKLYALKGDDLTVTRATSATRVNASGVIETVGANVPRLDYSNGSCPSILVEPERTNLLTYSEQFDNLFWTKVDASINSNVINSPNGTLTADKLVENTTNNVHLIYVPSNSVAIGSNTLSVYAKAGTRDWILMYLFDNVLGSLTAYFNVSNGTLGTIPSGLTANIQSLANGWYRCSITRTNSNLGNGGFGLASADNVASYMGDGTSGAYFWGAQLESGSYATSYIPTTSASVTRNADVISKTGISSLIGQTEGTMFIDINYKSDSVFKNLFNLGTSTSNYIAIVARSNNKIGAEVLNAGVQVNNEGATIYTSQRLKIAFAYKSNDFVIYVNGVLTFSQNSGTVPAKAEVYLGSYGNRTQQPKDGINSAALWKTRLSNTELAQLTTI